MIKEVLTINVRITEVNEVKGHSGTARMILFDGDAHSEYFTGKILPGGVDTQKYLNKNSTMLSARYILEGTDSEGHPCKIFVENNGVFINNGRNNGTSPTVYTDSKALAFLEREILYGKVEDTDNGVRIHIYSTGQKLRKKEKSYIAELVATPDKKGLMKGRICEELISYKKNLIIAIISDASLEPSSVAITTILRTHLLDR